MHHSCLKFILHFLCIIHLIFWMFVLVAPLVGSPRVLRFNIYFLVPMVYLLHILPFHVLIKCKELSMDGDKNKVKNAEDLYLGIPGIRHFKMLMDHCQAHCCFSPLSPQGMLLFCLIVSIFRLYPPSVLGGTRG